MLPSGGDQNLYLYKHSLSNHHGAFANDRTDHEIGITS